MHGRYRSKKDFFVDLVFLKSDKTGIIDELEKFLDELLHEDGLDGQVANIFADVLVNNLVL